MSGVLRVVESGWATTLQDLGRPGYQRQGVPVSGALDIVSLQLANSLVGNPPSMVAIEAAYTGPTLVAETHSVRMAVVGTPAKLERLPYAAAVISKPVAPNESFTLARGEALKVGTLQGGSVVYIAVEGGFDVPSVLGSAATDVRGGFGGWNGRALEPRDLLPLRLDSASASRERRMGDWLHKPRDTIRVVLGPQADFFGEESIKTFLSERFTVSSQASRMGLRLNGVPINHARGYNITSDGIALGSIQIMGNGQPMIMLADRPTTGGYPKIATIISADMPDVGRLAAGNAVKFETVSVAEAKYIREKWLDTVRRDMASITFLNTLDDVNLLDHNLISGVVGNNNWQEF